MSACCYALSDFQFNEDYQGLLTKLNKTASCEEWSFSIVGGNDKASLEEAIEDFEDECFAVYGFSNNGERVSEILISKKAVAIYICYSWKDFLFDLSFRRKSFDKGRTLGHALSISEMLYVPDAIFDGRDPVSLFFDGKEYSYIKDWCDKKLIERDNAFLFDGDRKHHDVYFIDYL